MISLSQIILSALLSAHFLWSNFSPTSVFLPFVAKKCCFSKNNSLWGQTHIAHVLPVGYMRLDELGLSLQGWLRSIFYRNLHMHINSKYSLFLSILHRSAYSAPNSCELWIYNDKCKHDRNILSEAVSPLFNPWSFIMFNPLKPSLTSVKAWPGKCHPTLYFAAQQTVWFTDKLSVLSASCQWNCPVRLFCRSQSIYRPSLSWREFSFVGYSLVSDQQYFHY